MARIVVIGATGHIGSYLIPRLVRAGHDVVAVSRGTSKPYVDDGAWGQVEKITLDRDSLEKQGAFGKAIADLKPQIVIDNICFTLESATQLAEALLGKVQHFLHIGTIWTHGFSEVVPTPRMSPSGRSATMASRRPRSKPTSSTWRGVRAFRSPSSIPAILSVRAGRRSIRPAISTMLLSATLARGERLALPNFGMETVHHVHADDIAQLLMLAIANWGAATGEAFHAVSPGAITLRYYAEAMSRWFGHEPDLEFLPWDEWNARQSSDNAQATWEHIARSPNCSIGQGQAPARPSAALHLAGSCAAIGVLADCQWQIERLRGAAGGRLALFCICPLFLVT